MTGLIGQSKAQLTIPVNKTKGGKGGTYKSQNETYSNAFSYPFLARHRAKVHETFDGAAIMLPASRGYFIFRRTRMEGSVAPYTGCEGQWRSLRGQAIGLAVGTAISSKPVAVVCLERCFCGRSGQTHSVASTLPRPDRLGCHCYRILHRLVGRDDRTAADDNGANNAVYTSTIFDWRYVTRYANIPMHQWVIAAAPHNLSKSSVPGKRRTELLHRQCSRG